ncbi:adenylate kinase-like [Helianthus annuus]|uniref:adenylate kinase-like n=1 Tax=Helianthus annuus TaxID=4232 RepID=UPI000B8F73B5|nr:adenylate kinase-like [Helianthus annuus]
MAVLSHLLRDRTTISYTICTFSSSYSTSPPSSSPENDVIKTPPDGRNVQWVFLSCPSVGKGTYASRLSKLLGVPHIATGDLVRDELNSKAPLSEQGSDARVRSEINLMKVIYGCGEVVVVVVARWCIGGEDEGG